MINLIRLCDWTSLSKWFFRKLYIVRFLYLCDEIYLLSWTTTHVTTAFLQSVDNLGAQHYRSLLTHNLELEVASFVFPSSLIWFGLDYCVVILFIRLIKDINLIFKLNRHYYSICFWIPFVWAHSLELPRFRIGLVNKRSPLDLSEIHNNFEFGRIC